MINFDKIKTYVGFAIKSRKIRYGVDDILKLKNSNLILVSKSLTESGLNKIRGFALRKSISVIELSEEEFNMIIQNNSIKVAAILDNNLADAIKMNLTNN